MDAIKMYLFFVFFLLAAYQAPVEAGIQSCFPKRFMTIAECERLTRHCAQWDIGMKYGGPGCIKDGKWTGAGCVFENYCNSECRSACLYDDNCKWTGSFGNPAWLRCP